MKKGVLILSSALILSQAFATNYSIVEGWQLVGAVDDINTSAINKECANHVWSYDTKTAVWSLYTSLDVSHNFSTIDKIQKTKGFWVHGKKSCNLINENINPPSKPDLNTSTSLNKSFSIVDTAQTKCYNSSTGIETTCTNKGYDADYTKNAPSYTLNSDKTIVSDNITNLMWTQSSDTDGDGLTTDAGDKKSYTQALNYCSNLELGGYNDWRLPDIKTLYSLIKFNGQDPSGYNGSTEGLITFLDTTFSKAFGDESFGERIIDGQYASSTKYVSTTMNGDDTMFGVNFVDGRIKGYPTSMRGEDKKFYVLCTRGNEEYGKNSFTDNNDQTILDNATNLMWQKDDFKSSNFEDAISTCENLNLAGKSDWRLPNAKELQSIVDYSKSPDTSNSPAIDSLFNSTSITNEKGQNDWGYYWSSTTHANNNGNGEAAVYLSFGRALGYMNNTVLDVHGAGSQRSNNKEDLKVAGSSSASGSTGNFEYHGPQGDILRVENMARCVRNMD